MRFDDDQSPFDTDNRAYQRLLAIAGDYFEVITWVRDRDDRPVLTTLIDLASGDMFTVAIIDSLEVRDPYALLAFTATGLLSTHGPFAGATAASSHTATLALGDSALFATRPAPLHHPDEATLPDTAWLDVPDQLAAAARPALADTPTAALVLLDRPSRRLAAIGPFTRPADALSWTPTPAPGPDTDRLVVPLHPVPPTARP